MNPYAHFPGGKPAWPEWRGKPPSLDWGQNVKRTPPKKGQALNVAGSAVDMRPRRLIPGSKLANLAHGGAYSKAAAS